MSIFKPYFRKFLILLFTTGVTLISSGCARYAPVYVAGQSDRVLSIQLDTAENIANDIYYYIAFDVSANPLSEGPLPYLAGDRIAENWNYYIRYYNGQFTEKLILSSDNLYEEPDLFYSGSTRYYSASKTDKQLTVNVKLDALKAGNFNLRLNFITSREPLQDSAVAVQVIDYLPTPRLVINTAVAEPPADSTQYRGLDHLVTTPEDKPGDITSWVVDVENL